MPFIPENELERALVAAVNNPAVAPEFYRLLLASDLLVLGTAEGREDASATFALAPGGRLNLVPGVKDGAKFLPVFSSLRRMQDYVKQESKYLSIAGHALLDLTRGAPVTLNPASDYGKELTAQQVAQLLAPQTRLTPAIVSNAAYPTALVEALKALFATRPDIEAAWMIQVAMAGAPHPVVGVATTGDFAALMRAIQAAAENTVPGMVFDVQRIDRQTRAGMTDALLQVAPFYQRRAFSTSTLN